MSEQSMHAPGALDGAPGDALARWQRWGWLPLLAGCAFIVIAVMVGSELYLDRNGGDTLAPSVHRFLIARGVIASALLAAYTGAFVWYSRRRVEAARAALREREHRIEKRAGMDAATRILAHEIRNPLNNMLLTIVVLERAIARQPAGSGCDKLLHSCQVMRGEVERLSALTAGYLDGRPAPLHRQPLVLEELAADVVEAYRPAIEARNLQVDVGGDGATVHADPARLRQLMHNLVKNALEAVAERGRIAIRCARNGSHATLEVSDDGPGFASPDEAFRLFHTTKEHGSGLGLAVVRDIARMHGGEVDAGNQSSGGARVTVRIPAGAAS
ncbi:MAG TPA: HAMP domain-containing sensor histidine kinase [Kofleriaceae bacterium]|nr:HAMP domain-containing sensor histidine kinase [Kofleriaceae bacterium]